MPACSPHCPFNAERQPGKLWIPILKSLVWPDSESNPSLQLQRRPLFPLGFSTQNNLLSFWPNVFTRAGYRARLKQNRSLKNNQVWNQASSPLTTFPRLNWINHKKICNSTLVLNWILVGLIDPRPCTGPRDGSSPTLVWMYKMIDLYFYIQRINRELCKTSFFCCHLGRETKEREGRHKEHDLQHELSPVSDCVIVILRDGSDSMPDWVAFNFWARDEAYFAIYHHAIRDLSPNHFLLNILKNNIKRFLWGTTWS